MIFARRREMKQSKQNQIMASPARFEAGFHLLNNWLKLKNEGKTLATFFHDNDFSVIAIYGMGALGERLYEELSGTEIKVAYAIDRLADKKSRNGLRIIPMEEELERTDVIIVTPIQDFEVIERQLELRTEIDIISLEDVVNYCR